MEGSGLNRGQPLVLADIDEEPLEPVVFPDGKQFDVLPFGPEQYAIYRGLMKRWDNRKAMKLLHDIVPGAGPEDFDTLSSRMMWILLEHARRKIDAVMLALKNAEAGRTESFPSSPRSKQKTRKDTSSRKSRKRFRG